MANEFETWLEQNGLSEVFTTSAGDTLYANKEKRFGVLKKYGEFGVLSFYLDDIIGFKTYDDENLVAEWSWMTPWRLAERSTRFSTNEVYMNIQFKTQPPFKLQIFRATNGNVKRSSYDHFNLLNYACQISQIVYNCANGL